MVGKVELVLDNPIPRIFKLKKTKLIEHAHDVPVRAPDGAGGMRQVMRLSKHTHEESVDVQERGLADSLRLIAWEEDLPTRALRARFTYGRAGKSGYEAASEDGIVFSGRGWIEAGFGLSRPVTEASILRAIASFKKWSGSVRDVQAAPVAAVSRQT